MTASEWLIVAESLEEEQPIPQTSRIADQKCINIRYVQREKMPLASNYQTYFKSWTNFSKSKNTEDMIPRNSSRRNLSKREFKREASPYKNMYLYKAMYKLSTLKSGVVGLKNIGNNCYMNSALQTLIHTTGLIINVINTHEIIESRGPRDKLPSKLIKEFCSLFYNAWKWNNSAYSPFELLSEIQNKNERFNRNSQGDSFEFLINFLDFLDQDIINSDLKYANELRRVSNSEVYLT